MIKEVHLTYNFLISSFSMIILLNTDYLKLYHTLSEYLINFQKGLDKVRIFVNKKLASYLIIFTFKISNII
jgi:hypothetical protein